MMGKPYIIDFFENGLCIPFIKSLMTNVRKTFTNKHNSASKYIMLIGVRGQIRYLFRLLTNKNIILMSKIVG